MLTNIGNGIKMAIRAAVDYKTERIKNELCYVQHIGVGICNIMNQQKKKKTDKYINIDPNCHRMIHIPHQNMNVVQFEFLVEKGKQHSIKIMLRSSDNQDHKKLTSKVIYEYNPSLVATKSFAMTGSIPPPTQSQIQYDQHEMNIWRLLFHIGSNCKTNDNKNVIINLEAITTITDFMQFVEIKTMDNEQKILNLRNKIANLEFFNSILLHTLPTQQINADRNNRKRLRESEKTSIDNFWNNTPKFKRPRIDPKPERQHIIMYTDDSKINSEAIDMSGSKIKKDLFFG